MSWPGYRRMIGRCRTWKEDPSATPSAVPHLSLRFAARGLCCPAGGCRRERARQQQRASATISSCFIRSYCLPSGRPSRSRRIGQMHGRRSLQAQARPSNEACTTQTKTSAIPLFRDRICAGDQISTRVFHPSRGKSRAGVFDPSRRKLTPSVLEPHRGSSVVAIASYPDAPGRNLGRLLGSEPNARGTDTGQQLVPVQPACRFFAAGSPELGRDGLVSARGSHAGKSHAR